MSNYSMKKLHELLTQDLHSAEERTFIVTFDINSIRLIEDSVSKEITDNRRLEIENILDIQFKAVPLCETSYGIWSKLSATEILSIFSPYLKKGYDQFWVIPIVQEADGLGTKDAEDWIPTISKC